MSGSCSISGMQEQTTNSTAYFKQVLKHSRLKSLPPPCSSSAAAASSSRFVESIFAMGAEQQEEELQHSTH